MKQRRDGIGRRHGQDGANDSLQHAGEGDATGPKADGPMNSLTPQLVRVWDGPTRLFHWALVAAVTTASITGYLAPEWWMGVHTWSGYVIVLLLVFRLVWAVFGSEYSHIASWAHPPP